MGDRDGTVVALGERDCSIQRRHQKLVEEAPAPGLSPEQRRELHGMAVKVAPTVGLRNAATAEFLREPEGEFFFLEVNARLQVEHGVTELVSRRGPRARAALAGRRSCRCRVAAWRPRRAAAPTRHAIEVRISAEDPARAFAPTPGLAHALARCPRARASGWTRRRRRGCRQHDYDPLLAKLMVVADDRPAALSRLRRALLEFETGGIQTTLPFHTWLLRHPAFLEGRLRTDLIDLDWDPAPIREAAARAAAKAVARHVAGEAAAGTTRHPARNPPSAVAAAGYRRVDLDRRILSLGAGRPPRSHRALAVSADERLRLTVLGPDDLVIELEPGQAEPGTSTEPGGGGTSTSPGPAAPARSRRLPAPAWS